MSARQTFLRPLGPLRVAAFLSIAWIAAFLSVTVSAADFELQVDDNRVSINSNGADLGEIMRRLSEEAGFQLLMPAGMSRPSSRMEMQDAPLKRVINRLLKDDSFVVITGDGDRIVAVHVLPRGNEQTVFMEITEESSSTSENQESSQEVPQAGSGETVEANDNGS